MKILLMEDDRVLSDTIKDVIIDAGYMCDVAYTGDSALDMLYDTNYDLYLFDINVPGINGLKLLEELREADDLTPTILITSLAAEDDVINGYNHGCDDYLRKPFSLAELCFKIRIMFNRIYGLAETKIRLKENLVFDMTTYEIFDNEKIIQLKKKEGQLLSLFIRNKGQVLAKEDIIASLWHDSIPSDAVIRVYMSSLKRTLGNDLLITVRGLGYKLERL
jgi:DNA-binding response OmpR family regulator